MSSKTTRHFREAYRLLPDHVQRRAREASRRVEENPQHRSLRFELVHATRPIYATRVGLGHRALGIVEGDTIVWFWIGTHAEYDRLPRTLCAVAPSNRMQATAAERPRPMLSVGPQRPEGDERMKKILTDAANIGAVTARTLAFKIREPEAFFYPNSSWRLPFFGGYKFEAAPGVANLDGAAFFYYFATGVTPAMEEKMVGQGSQYPWASLDSKGNPFDGGKTYKLRLPPNIPVKDFWSVIVYDNQTRSMLQTDQQAPSVSSQDKGFKTNADGSVDVWFGPKAPPGMEKNWVQTIPGKGWFMILRLYGPLEPWFNKTWRPGEIELQP